MEKKSIYFYLWPVLASVAVASSLFIYSQAQGPIPIHFNFRGEPDNWMSPAGFLIFFALIMTYTYGLLVLLYWKTDRLWPNFINLPNKAHWIANPEKGKAKTRAVLCLTGSFVSVVFCLCHVLIYSAAMNAGFVLPTPVFLVVLVVLIAGFFSEIYRISRPN